jgi:molybdopterin-synthase adenylyltransferase
MNSILITKPDKTKILKHLIRDPNQENMAVTYCGINKNGKHQQLLVKDFELIQDNDFEVHTATSLRITEKLYRRILLRGQSKKTGIMIWHSHPFSDNAWFSSIDDSNDKKHATFLKEHLPEMLYGNVVVAQKGDKARLFNKEKETFEDIQKIITLGQPQKTNKTKYKAELDRNYRAFGRPGQAMISKQNLALIGSGGIIWHVAPQLVGIGGGNILLVDHDKIEITNLNRLPGAPHSSVGKPKVNVLADLLKQMNPKLKVKTIAAKIPDPEVMNELKKYDVIIGGVDSDLTRSELNRFAIKYLKPYLDAGSGILLENGKVKHAGGQVRVVIPGESPCLACNNELNWRMISYESLNENEQKNEIKRGYIKGVNEPAPSIVSINGIVASALVNEFIALTTGLKKPNYYTYFDYMNSEKMMFPVEVKKNENCIICSRKALFAYGDIIQQTEKSPGLPSFITNEKL